MRRRVSRRSRRLGDVGPPGAFGTYPPRGSLRPLGAARRGLLMLLFRLIFGLLLVCGVLCFAMSIATGQPVWRRRGMVLVKWTVVAGLAFFAVLILERMALML